MNREIIELERNKIIGSNPIINYEEIRYNIEILNLSLQILELYDNYASFYNSFNEIYNDFLFIIDRDFVLPETFDEIVSWMNEYLMNSEVYNNFISSKFHDNPAKEVRDFVFYIPSSGDVYEIRDLVRVANLSEIACMLKEIRGSVKNSIISVFNTLLKTRLLAEYDLDLNNKYSDFSFNYKSEVDYIGNINEVKRRLQEIYDNKKISLVTYECSLELMDVLLENCKTNKFERIKLK